MTESTPTPDAADEPVVEGYDAPQDSPEDDAIEAAHAELENTDQDVFDAEGDDAEPGEGVAV